MNLLSLEMESKSADKSGPSPASAANRRTYPAMSARN
jgi:hypothetical protein